MADGEVVYIIKGDNSQFKKTEKDTEEAARKTNEKMTRDAENARKKEEREAEKAAKAKEREANKAAREAEKAAKAVEKAEEQAARKAEQEAKKAADAIRKEEEAAARDAEKAAENRAERMGNIATKIGSGIATAGKVAVATYTAALTAVTGMVTALAKSGVEYNAQMEKFEVAFTTLLGDANEAAAVMAQIKRDAAATPFDVASLTQANQLLIGAGVSAKEARDTIIALGDAVSATGGGSDELARMAANLQQIKNVGKATAMDIRQFAMAGINIYSVLADYTGLTTEEVKDLDISYEVLSAALVKASQKGGAFYGAMINQSKTFNGLVSTLKDNWAQLLGNLTAGLQEVLKDDALPSLLDYVRQLQEAFDAGGIMGAIDKLGDILGDAFGKIAAALPSAAKIIFNLTNTILAAIIAEIPRIVDEIAAAVPEIANAIFSLIRQLVAVIKSRAGLIGETLAALARDAALFVAEIIPEIIDAVLIAAVAALPVLLEAIPDLVRSIGDALKKALPILTAATAELLTALFDFLASDGAAETITALGDIIQTLIFAAFDIIEQLLPVIVKAIPPLLKSLSKAITAAIANNKALLNALGDGLKSLISSFMAVAREILPDLIKSLVDFIGENAPKYVEYLADVIELLAVELLPEIVTAFAQILPDLIVALTEAIIENLPAIVTALVGVLGAIFDGLFKNGEPVLLKFLAEMLSALYSGIAAAGLKLWSAIFAAIEKAAEKLQNAARNFVGKIYDAVRDAVVKAWEKIKGIGEKIAAAIKKLFGIEIGDTSAALDISETRTTNETGVGENLGEYLLGSSSGYAVPSFSPSVVVARAPALAAATAGAPSFDISLSGDVVMDGLAVGTVVLRNFDDATAFA